MNTVVTGSLVLGDDDHFAPLQEQWEHHVRRRFQRGPDAHEALLDAIATDQPRTVLEVEAGSGEFAGQVNNRTDSSILVSEPNALLALQAAMRRLRVVVAHTATLPVASGGFDCVVARQPDWSADETDGALSEIARVLDDDGTLLVVAASRHHDGHELDALVGATLRRVPVGLTAENGVDLLSEHFGQVQRTDLDYALTFPTGAELASYLMAIPARRHLADRVRPVSSPVRLSFGRTMFVAFRPRR